MIPSTYFFKLASNASTRAVISSSAGAFTSHFARSRFFSISSIRPRQRVVEETWSKTLADEHYSKLEGSITSKDELGSRFVVTWEHPKVSCEETREIVVAHHAPKTTSDHIAKTVLFLMRKGFDIVTGYKHTPKGMENDPKYIMSEKHWLERFVFL